MICIFFHSWKWHENQPFVPILGLVYDLTVLLKLLDNIFVPDIENKSPDLVQSPLLLLEIFTYVYCVVLCYLVGCWWSGGPCLDYTCHIFVTLTGTRSAGERVISRRRWHFWYHIQYSCIWRWKLQDKPVSQLTYKYVITLKKPFQTKMCIIISTTVYNYCLVFIID